MSDLGAFYEYFQLFSGSILLGSQLFALSLLLRSKSKKQKKASDKPISSWPSLTVIVPCHNEEGIIAECLKAVSKANYPNLKSIIVVDDASSDHTPEILNKTPGITVLRNPTQLGKSRSLNRALELVRSELVAVIDGDSVISADALTESASCFTAKDIGGVSCVIRVLNQKRVLTWWVHLELLHFSLMRQLLSGVNANITTPGPLSMYRTAALDKVGRFSARGYSEDADIGIRLIREGYRMAFSSTAEVATVMPERFVDIFRQRLRWSRGLIYLLKTHLRFSTRFIDWYTLPVLFVGYFSSLVLAPLSWHTIYQGYIAQFWDQGIILSPSVYLYLLDWASLAGTAQHSFHTFHGDYVTTLADKVGVMSSLLGISLFIVSIIRFEKKFTLRHLVPLFFLQPLYWILNIVSILAVPTVLSRTQNNLWSKRSTLPYNQASR